MVLVLVIIVSYLVATNAISDTSINAENGEVKKGIIYPFGEFTTNLSDKGFIKMKVELEVKDKNSITAIEDRESEYKDKIINIIRSKAHDEVTGKEGMENIKKSILTGLNQLQGSETVINVFLTELIIN